MRQAARAFIAAHEQDVIDLTCDLVAAPSPNLPGDETAPARVMQHAIAALGLPEPRIVASAPHRPNLIVTIDTGRPGPRLGLCGHLDTKPVGEAAELWRTDPFTPTIQGDRLYGLGSTDMKGACAAMVYAGAAFRQAIGELNGSLSLIFTADEEYGSVLGAEYLVRQNALDVDVIVLGEPSGVRTDWEAIRTVSRGFAGFRIAVHGTQMHSSITDDLPNVNAVEAMARILVALRRELNLTYPPHPLAPQGPTINLGVRCQGGVGYGVLPGYAEFWNDIRTLPGMTREQLERDVRDALKRIEPEYRGATVDMAFHELLGWLEPTEVEPSHPIVPAMQHACRTVLGVDTPLRAFPGASDAWPFQGIGGIPTIAGFGPGLLPLAHGPNEYVSINAVKQAAHIYAETAFAFCGSV
ncbi:MAG: M20/M25/M40 family metallo-hydrolase [Solirubrobacterales bacterium]|nr:M20/M25/M40 family metallo-hydrolase [Solirubrobacterales bacterium]